MRRVVRERNRVTQKETGVGTVSDVGLGCRFGTRVDHMRDIMCERLL